MIAVDGLCKSYGSRQVLSDVSAEFPAGQLTALIGPNGAGKSTLLMLIARLLAPGAGTITLSGRDIVQIPIADYARQVATLRQMPALDLRLTVEDLVSFGRFPYSRGRLTADDRRAVDHAISFLSLDQMRHARIDELSGGQRQMAFLAMTIAQETPCLLLDEPLNNLDIHHGVQIMSALRELCDGTGRTVVLVIHDINFAINFADRILALKGGRVHSAGTVDELATPSRLSDLFDQRCEILNRPTGRLCDYFTKGETE
ncbi:ATP-binding cassette domain-containing protein [Paracoccus caeni]|uniref:ATP-binding cassette domain-containing protein n=1 Tax=Paracoccus caeni TaxID=657651 RepID=A0A934S8Y5_9RHOB|nr:ATP-binding cassette domain-containing protein [Paracoccus caeni]MBK4214311.1 ATP-binding cassette domain-containing protein [Paracoccus caeni]